MQLFLSSQGFSRGLIGQDQNNRSQILPYSIENSKAYKVGQPKIGSANISSLPLSQQCKKNHNQFIHYKDYKGQYRQLLLKNQAVCISLPPKGKGGSTSCLSQAQGLEAQNNHPKCLTYTQNRRDTGTGNHSHPGGEKVLLNFKDCLGKQSN